jgi:uncharacterized protein
MKYLLLSFLFLASFSGFAQDDEDEPKALEKTESPLMKAVRAKNLAEVKRLVNAGAPVDERSRFDFGSDPVDVAIQMNSREIALFLLEKGATSRSGLCDAIETGDIAWVEKLIGYGFKCSDGVLNAVEAHKPQMVRMLIQNGFRVDFEQKRRTGLFRKHYVSPLGAAISIGSDEMILDLVKGGANQSQAFNYAITSNRIKLGQQLIDASPERGDMFLLCFEHKSLDLAKYCIQKGVDKNTIDKNGMNAYHYAVIGGYREGMDYCVNALKMDPLKKTATNQTSLMLACSAGNVTLFKELFETQKSTLEEEDLDGQTVLYYALTAENWPIMEYLTTNGANVNHQNKYGTTVFMKSALKEKKEYYSLLKQAKPDLKLKNNNGENIISFLMNSNSYSANEILEMNSLGASMDVRSTKGETMAFYAMQASNMEVLIRLKNSGLSLDAFDSEGKRPNCQNAEILKFAVSNGCNPNRGDDWGDSYLTKALKDNDTELALFLIRNGADVNWKKRDEPIVFEMVNTNNFNGLQLLVENGAKINVSDRSGETLMNKAESKENESIVIYLKSKGAKNKKELAEMEIVRAKEIAQLDQFITDKNLQEVTALMEKYPDLMLTKKQVSGLAILSVEKINLPLLQRLIEKEGMNINQALNFQEQNLLHIAAGTGNLDLVRLLINKGADYKKKDAYDKFPIDYAKSKEVKKYLKSL